MEQAQAEQQPQQQEQQVAQVGTRVYAWGSAETDQFPMPDPDRYESRRPVLIDDFVRLQVQIRSIACGSQHTVFLSTQGHVYTMGSGDEGQLGREGTDASPVNRPAKVELPVLCDMITAGECHSTASNSLNGIIYTWGVFRNTQGNMMKPVRIPIRTGLRDFQGKKFQKVLSGNNHVMVLTTDNKLFVWGDNETHVLGRPPRAPRVRGAETSDVSEVQTLPIEVVVLRGIRDIFCGGYHCFAVTQQKVRGQEAPQDCVYAWGKNNFGELGIGNEDHTYTPTEVTVLTGRKVAAITGGEDHTIFLLDDGSLYGCGRNDDHQLGPINNDDIPYTEEEQAKLAALPPAEGEGAPAPVLADRRNDIVTKPIRIHMQHQIARIFANSHYTIVASTTNAFFSWGCGMSYVLGNLKDDGEIRDPHPIPETFFLGAPISHLSLGSNHVVYAAAPSYFEQLPINFSLERVRQPRQKPTLKTETDSVHSLLEQRLEQKVKEQRGRKLAVKAEKEAAEQAANAIAGINGAKSPSNRSKSPAGTMQEEKAAPKSTAKVQRKPLAKPTKRSSKADKSKPKAKRDRSAGDKSKSKSVKQKKGSTINRTKSSRSTSKKQLKATKTNGKPAAKAETAGTSQAVAPAN